MSYEMKKSLRRGAGAKSYAELDDADLNVNNESKDREKEQRESIFEHKNWTPKQKVKLMIFLSHYHSLADWHSERRSIHLYKHLSNFLKKSRTPEQCKNIHSLLKRKFASLEEVVQAMQKELQSEENYQKLVSKYERDIEKFEKEHMLFDGIAPQKPTAESGRARKTVDRMEKEEEKPPMIKQYEESEHLKIKGDNIKHEQPHFENSMNRLAFECQYYFNQWLKCVSVIEYKNKMQGGG